MDSETKRNIVVVGASAGGVEALQRLTRGLPGDLPATIFVVMHLPPWRKSELPEIITRSGGLIALEAQPEQPFQRGRIYVAPPDYHLLVERDFIRLWRGPKENRHRPAINTLFRSAAVAHKNRVVGVILSGALDDGSTGLWWIKQFGGLAVVQDPKDARHPSMPQNALEHVDVDYVARAVDLGPLLSTLVTGDHIGQLSSVLPKETSEWKRRKS
jgi:two-component system chemotaxis response regulator CheB